MVFHKMNKILHDSRMFPCPKCGNKSDKVMPGSSSYSSHVWVRFHECQNRECKHNFTTWQLVVNEEEIKANLRGILDRITQLLRG